MAAEFEPLPRIGVLQAARRHWIIALLPILVLVPVVAIIAAKRTPTYSAEARLIVGRLNISTPGAVAGFTQAAQDLAATYPLLIGADGVIKPVARNLHLPPGAVRASVSATEVPSSSVIRVDATANSEYLAVRLANGVSNALVGYLATVNRHDPDVSRAAKLLQRSELAYVQAKARLPTGKGLSPADERRIAAAETAKVQLDGVVQIYDSALQNHAGSPLLQPVAYAASATSDRRSKLELGVFVALVAGLIIGLALATLRANLSLKRALTLPRWEPTVTSRTSSSDASSETAESRGVRSRQTSDQ